MFEDVPDADEIEARGPVAARCEFAGIDLEIGAGRDFGVARSFDAAHAGPTPREQAQEGAAAAADVEHAGVGTRQPQGQAYAGTAEQVHEALERTSEALS